jgi:glycosyltransferase involved in cell wall biosynthesis
MKRISIVTPCFNEVENVDEMHTRVKQILESLKDYEYEHIFIDNCSTDGTVIALKRMAASDSKVKVILNVRNFGPERSGAYAVLQATGDAVIGLACDFQDPPELIPKFIELWQLGHKVVFGQKTKSEENKLMFSVRTLYYKM